MEEWLDMGSFEQLCIAIANLKDVEGRYLGLMPQDVLLPEYAKYLPNPHQTLNLFGKK